MTQKSIIDFYVYKYMQLYLAIDLKHIIKIIFFLPMIIWDIFTFIHTQLHQNCLLHYVKLKLPKAHFLHRRYI